MKSSLVFTGIGVSLTALSTSAQAADPITRASAEALLREAACLQDWGKAVDATGILIAQPTISDGPRIEFAKWRYRFSNYQAVETKFDEIPNCEGIEVAEAAAMPQVELLAPRFSQTTLTSQGYYCYKVEMDRSVRTLERMCRNGRTAQTSTASTTSRSIANSAAVIQLGDVWTLNIHFNNKFWSLATQKLIPTMSVRGNAHNSRAVLAQNLTVEATEYAEERLPQAQQKSTPSISADIAKDVTFNFDLSNTDVTFNFDLSNTDVTFNFDLSNTVES